MKKSKLYPLLILSIFIFIVTIFAGCGQKKSSYNPHHNYLVLKIYNPTIGERI